MILLVLIVRDLDTDKQAGHSQTEIVYSQKLCFPVKRTSFDVL